MNPVKSNDDNAAKLKEQDLDVRIKPGWEDTAHVEKMARAPMNPVKSNDDNAAKLKEQDLDVRIKPEWEDKQYSKQLVKRVPAKPNKDNGMLNLGLWK